jgi:CDP-4-dehydro-6-deoxyglucose reductase
MPAIYYQECSYTSAGNESVLDTLLRNHVAIPYGCRAGACQACTLQADVKLIPEDCQQGLSAEQIRQGYFLACRCIPDQDMQLQQVDLQAQKIPATVSESFLMDEHTLCLRLNCRLRWRAGQYITLWISDTARCYSIASVARLDPFVELHVRIYPNGALSKPLSDTVKIGDSLQLQGPLGRFVYQQDNPEQKLLLIGAGTGIAPLIGIARDAIDHHHTANIHLLAVDKTGTSYAVQPLSALQNSAPTFSYQTNDVDNIEKIFATEFPNLRGQKIYICGSDEFVKSIRKKCFMLGASPRNIVTEEFINFMSEAGVDRPDTPL